jgi:hypothetical protein
MGYTQPYLRVFKMRDFRLKLVFNLWLTVWEEYFSTRPSTSHAFRLKNRKSDTSAGSDKKTRIAQASNAASVASDES